MYKTTTDPFVSFEFFFGKSHTCPHCTPADTPTLCRSTPVGFEHQVDDVAHAGDIGWQGGATGLAHQGGPVSICDVQVVVYTAGRALSLEVSEL